MTPHERKLKMLKAWAANNPGYNANVIGGRWLRLEYDRLGDDGGRVYTNFANRQIAGLAMELVDMTTDREKQDAKVG